MLILIAHRILIGTAIVFGAFYTGWEVLAFRRTHDAVHVMVALIAAVVTLGMAYYLKNLRRFVSHR